MLDAYMTFINTFHLETFEKDTTLNSKYEPHFEFSYGFGFVLYTIGIFLAEINGILNICLFDKLQKELTRLNQVFV